MLILRVRLVAESFFSIRSEQPSLPVPLCGPLHPLSLSSSPYAVSNMTFLWFYNLLLQQHTQCIRTTYRSARRNHRGVNESRKQDCDSSNGCEGER